MCSLNWFKCALRYAFALALISTTCTAVAFAQTSNVPALERSVSLSVRGIEIREVLSCIAAQTDVVFSYSSLAFDPTKKTSIAVDGKPVRYVLNAMFQGAVTYKAKGKYIILAENPNFGVLPSSVSKSRTIEGYISEPISGKKLYGVTVYDRNSMASSTTNEYGYFTLTIPEGESTPDIKMSKEGYLDVAINQTKEAFNFLMLNLSPDSLKQAFGMEKASFKPDTIQLFPEWIIPQRLKINTTNLNETLYRPVQASFVPYIGTNLWLTGSVKNDYSFNVLAGYVKGVRKLEMGGVLNIVRDSARYVQLAGVGNYVGNSAIGVQAAGVFNKTKKMNGVQLAGVLNVVLDSSRYVQASGVGNITGAAHNGIQAAGVFNRASSIEGGQLAGVANSAQTVHGMQAAGVFNSASSVNGAQLAGVANIALDSSSGLQAGGVANITGATHVGIQAAGVFNSASVIEGIQLSGVANSAQTVHGVQAAGVFNRAKSLYGAQLAEIMNYADSVEGIQLSWLLNKATYVKGFQVGIINIADTVAGIPVGLFSYVRKGYHNIELSCDDIFYGNAAFRSGVPLFHSVMFVGMRPNSDANPLWTYGFGVGSTLRVKRNFYVDMDITTQQLLKGNDYLKNSRLVKTYLGVEQKFSKRFSMAAGGTLNFMTFDSNDDNSVKYLSTLVPHTLNNKPTNSGYTHQTWLGWKVAFRFY